MICSSVKRLRLMFWSSRWARTNFKLDYPRGATPAVVDDHTRECLALIADTSLSDARVVRELDAVISLRG